MELQATGSARLILAIAAVDGARDETLVVEQDGRALDARELSDGHGTRLHEVDVERGAVTVRYRATVVGRSAPVAVDELDAIAYLRPSRYCESDTLTPMAVEEFSGLSGWNLVDGVSSWVGTHLMYQLGSSGPTDGATATMLARRGVCRDFAHLVVALLRAMDVPARVVAVYAPGLDPMDFHAVAEVLLDGEWWVVDATSLAPRRSMVRIATGRDAADTAFLTTIGEPVDLVSLEVFATVDDLPADDPRVPERLG